MSDFVLTDLAAQDIEDLEKAGIRLTAQEVLTIQKLSLDVQRGALDTGALGRGRPVELCPDEWLWPLTLAADEFYRCYQGRSDKSKLEALAYALRFGGDREAIGLRGKEAVRAVRKWASSLPCTYNRIAEVVERLAGDVDARETPEDEIAKEERTVSLSLMAAAMAGGSPEMWETSCSIEAVASVIDTIVAQRLADRGADVDCSHMHELRRLAVYERGIRDRWEARHGS